MTKQALEKMITGTQQERKFLAEQSFGLFAIYYFKDYFKYALAPYHYDFVQDCHDLVDGKIKEVGWIGYRECAKTTFAKLFIIWLIATGKRKYINVDAFDKENAERILFDVAFEMVNNKRLQYDFGVLFSKERSINDIKQNRINNFVTENGTRIEAHSTQESVRGRLHLNQRPDALILDDIETNKTKDSQAYTKQVKDHISEAMAGMSPDGFMLYLGNYITEYGNIAYLFERAKKNQDIRMRNIPIMVDGKPTWEAKYAMTDEEAKATGKVSIEEKQRQLGSLVFSYEMMNTPIDDSITEFKKEFIQTAVENDYKHFTYNTFITIDPAVSEKTSADFTGITINRVTQENKRYITAYKLKINTKELIDHIFYLWETYYPNAIGIEETTFTIAIKPFLDEEMRKRNVYPIISQLKHNQTNKETRIRALIPLWESKSIFLVGDNSALLEEMRVFPRGNHDDCIAEGTLILTNKGQVPIEKIKIGDYVMTRNGYQKVLKTWDKGEKQVINKIGFFATPDHKIITTKKEKELQYINESDILHVWNTSKQKIEKLSYIKVKNIIDTQNLKDINLGNTIGDTINGKNHHLLYTDRFGLIKMGRYLKNIISITKMAILSIIVLKTYNVSVLKNTQSTTHNLMLQEKEQVSMLRKIMQKCKKQQKTGGIVKKVKNGIQNIQKIVLTSLKKLLVFCVAKKQLDLVKTQDFVQKNAEINIIHKNLEKKTQITTKKVYDLMVENDHEFFANNILVHNCIDSLAYQLQIEYKPNNYADWDSILGADTPLYEDIGL